MNTGFSARFSPLPAKEPAKGRSGFKRLEKTQLDSRGIDGTIR